MISQIAHIVTYHKLPEQNLGSLTDLISLKGAAQMLRCHVQHMPLPAVHTLNISRGHQ